MEGFDVYRRVAKFEKVSFEQFKNDFTMCFGEIDEMGNVSNISDSDIESIYNNISLPARKTVDSAGYDFKSPISFNLRCGESITIPTGIRCKMRNDVFLGMYPRSGLGFKYRIQLNNTVGIIDSDYYGADNEGHIMVKLSNDGYEGKEISIDAGDGIVQGIFQYFGLTEDDTSDGERRVGGFGSTDNN